MNEEPRFLPLILASGSKSRFDLMGRLGLHFKVHAPDIDETAEAGEDPGKLVERLSRQKARVISLREPDAVVIGSDQVAVFQGIAASKPGSAARARALLARYSGQEVTFLTGLCVLQHRTNFVRQALDQTVVRFRALKAEEIERYVQSDAPEQCAGGFRVESLGVSLFEEVRSTDPTALLGLPMIRLCGFLRDTGFRLP